MLAGYCKEVVVKTGKTKTQHNPRRLKWILAMVILILAGIVSAIFIHYRYSVQMVDHPERPEETDASFVISRFEHTAMKEERRDWTMKAASAKFYADSRRVGLEALEAVFFSENGESTKVTADQGEMDMATQNIRARGNVVVVHPQYRLMTESLNYKYDSRIMIIDAPLEIEGEGLHFRADAGRYEMNEETILFEGNIESWFDGTLGL